MKKQTIIGIAVVAVLFIGFSYFVFQDQKRYQGEMKVYEAYLDSVAKAEAALRPLADMSAAGAAAVGATALAEGQAAGPVAADGTSVTTDSTSGTVSDHQRNVAELGACLADARGGEPTEIAIENEVMRIRFSTRGGQVAGVTLKDHTRYAPNERTEPIELFDPASARFNLSFFVRNGLNSVEVNTTDYLFHAEEVRTVGDAQQLVMRLPVAEGAWLEYEYLVYDAHAPERDHLVDFKVRMVNLAPQMANQTSIGIDWAQVSYQNEKGFQNENIYSTLAYHFPGENSIENLGRSDGAESKDIATSIDWVAFKQQFFSSVLIAPKNFSGANMAFDTAVPGSGIVKKYTTRLSVPYTSQTEGWDFAFYFGPNQYSILKKVEAVADDNLELRHLVPLGWGIFGWVNRYCVIPVFDFLRNYIDNFGIIILILVILVKLVIFPLTYKSYLSMAKMRLIKPQVDELAKKYPKQEDAMKKQQATMALYKQAGVNPMGGCIPMLIQMPILIAMFNFFPASIELRDKAFLWADDLSSFDSVWNLPFSIPFYGDHVSLFALLMAISMFGYSYFSYQQTASAQPQMAGMKFMMVYLMPVMMLLWFNSYASGLCYYYLLSNLITIGQTLVIRRMVDDDKIQAVMQANAAKKGSGKKSKFQLRYEEMLRQQQAQQKGKGKK